MTDLQTTRFMRKPLYINAIQVTEENIEKVAEWSGGEIRTARNPKSLEQDPFIHIAVVGAKHQRQTMAFVGDWVLCFRDHFKIYTKKAFPEAFDQVTVSNGVVTTDVFMQKDPVTEHLRQKLNDTDTSAMPHLERLRAKLNEAEKIYSGGIHKLSDMRADMGFDAIVHPITLKVIKNGTREECLEWTRKHRESSEDVLVSAYDRHDFISGTQYLVTYG